MVFLTGVKCHDIALFVNNNGDSINTEAKFEENATLHCNDSSLSPGQNFEFQYWIRPDSVIMEKNDHEEFRILDGLAGWQVSTNGMELTIVHVQEKQFGHYICVYKDSNSGKIIAAKRGLNVNGPYFGDLWEIYKMNTIIGLGSVGVFLILAVIIGLTYKFKYVQHKEEDGAEEINVSIIDLEPTPSSYSAQTREVPTAGFTKGGSDKYSKDITDTPL